MYTFDRMSQTIFYLIRHGETDWNVLKRLQGHEDIPLNAAGVKQAIALAQELQNVTFQAVYASPLSRAHETAKILNRERQHMIVTDPRLKEASYGTLEGLNREEYLEKIGAKLSERNVLHLLDKMSFKFDQTMESYLEVYSRVREFLDEVMGHHFGEQIAIVSHGGVIRSLIATLEKIDPLSIEVQNTGYVIFKVDQKQYTPIEYCRVNKERVV